MEAPIVEIFSSFQGEGIWIGRRQIFIRFSGCNLACNYCDTQKSQSEDFGTLMTVDEVLKEVKNLTTPDLHSISFTGGEPLLYVDFINKVIEKMKSSENIRPNIQFMLETNGTLPESLAKIDGIDCVSLDIKLPEHFDDKDEYGSIDNDAHDSIVKDEYGSILQKEIKSLKFLIEHDKNVYCKMVVLPSSKTNTIKNVINKIFKEISQNISQKNLRNRENNEDKLDILWVIQPSSPLTEWKNQNNKLFAFSEMIGQYMDVLIIPQTHKLLNIE